MRRSYGRAGCLSAQNGGFRPGQCAAVTCDGSYLRPATGHDPLERSALH
jgi:hypothetical protein